MERRLNAATIIGGALVLFGLAATIASFQINPESDGSWGARIFPFVGSVAITMTGAIELLGGLNGTKPGALRFGRDAYNVVFMLLIAIIYVFLITKLGYLIATGIAAVLTLWMFGIRNPVGLIIAAILCPAIYHVLFFELLGVFPPSGEWFDLLDIIRG